MGEYNPSKIWYASERRARTCLKLIVHDDTGILAIHQGVLKFAGRRGTTIDIKAVTSMELASQSSNWPVHVIAISIVYTRMIARGFSSLFALVLLGLTAMVASTIGYSTKWVRVTYQADNGEATSAWFADGSAFGWASVLGETTKLYDVIRANTLEHSQSAWQSSDEWIVLGPVPRDPNEPVEEECPWCQAKVVPNEDRRCSSCDRPI